MADIPIRAGDGSEAHDETPIVVDEFPRVPTEISPPSAMPLPTPSTHESRDALLGALHRAGLDADMLGPIAEGLARGDQLEALLLKSFGALVAAPPLPRRAGSLLVVAGAGGSARALAAAVAADIGVDPAEVPFASLDPEAHTVMTHSRLVRSTEEAGELAPGWRRSQVAVVVVDAPVTARLSWAAHMITTLRPTAVWGIVDATSKDEDIASWAEALGGVDALALENVVVTMSPAAVLSLGIPVVRLDGQPANAALWTAIIVDRVKGGEANRTPP